MAAFESKNEWLFCFEMSTLGPFFYTEAFVNLLNMTVKIYGVKYPKWFS